MDKLPYLGDLEPAAVAADDQKVREAQTQSLQRVRHSIHLFAGNFHFYVTSCLLALITCRGRKPGSILKLAETTSCYVELLTSSQGRLFAYIYSLTGDPEQANDVLQETNRKLWQLMEDYDPEREFLPWAFKVGFNQVRAARKKVSRDRLVFQEDATLEAIHHEQMVQAEGPDERLGALEHCLGKLAPDQRQLVERYYRKEEPIKAIAESLERRANAVAVSLHRIRQALADCIRSTTT